MSAPGRREVAHRVFAAEYDDATLEYSESDEERAPNYVVTPTGARVNRLFFVGVLTEVESVSEDVLRARVADPTGAFVVYAGQYQPDALAFLERAEPPTFVAVTGKARTFSPDDSDRVFTSVRPESINEVDAGTRDRWTLSAAEATLARVATFAAALELDADGDRLREALADSGVDEATAAGIPRALAEYGTGEAYLAAMRDLALDAARWVAGELDEVPDPRAAPDDPGAAAIDYERLAAAVDAVVELRAPERVEASDGDPAGGDESVDAETAGPASAEASPSPERLPGTGEAVEARSDADASTAAAGEGTERTDDGVGGESAEPTAAAGTGSDDGTAGTGSDDQVGDFEPGGLDGEPATADERTTDDGGPVDAVGSEGEESDAVEGDAVEPAGEEPAGGEVDDSAGVESGVGEPDADESPGDVLDEDERERIEEEYPGFSTGGDVDEPGEAGIEPEAGPIEPGESDESPGATESSADAGAAEPVADAGADEPAPDADESATEPVDEEPTGAEPAGEESTEEEPAEPAEAEPAEEEPAEAEPAGEASGGDEEPPEEVDLEDAVVDAMGELDDGDGADGEAVVTAVVEEYGAEPGAVEDAIQEALMAGRCYEPDDGVYKPI